MNDDSPVLYNRAIILGNLFMLIKHQCLITAFLGNKKLLLTSMIDVNLKNNTVVLDTSVVEKLNNKLLSTPRVKFCTVFNGIHVAFTGESIARIKQGKYDVFVMPIPRSLFWFNRRDAYRVKVPDLDLSICKLILFPSEYIVIENKKQHYDAAINKIKLQVCEQIEHDLIQEEKDFFIACSKMSETDVIEAKIQREKILKEREDNPIPIDENLFNMIKLRLFDISITGCAMLNCHEEFSHFLNPRTLYKNCIIIMPDHGEIEVSLEVVTKRDFIEDPDSQEVNEFNELVCFKFVDAEPSAESLIFRYIQALDRLQKKHSIENLLTMD